MDFGTIAASVAGVLFTIWAFWLGYKTWKKNREEKL